MTKTRTTKAAPPEKILVERVQTGVRLEKRLLKVLKGLAEYHDMTLGDLLEGIVLHAFDGRIRLEMKPADASSTSSGSINWIWTPTRVIDCWKLRTSKPKQRRSTPGKSGKDEYADDR